MIDSLKKAYATLKKIWANERGKAAIKLGFYFVFMAIVVIMINISNSNATIGNNSNNTTNNASITQKALFENYKDMSNYKAVFTLEDTNFTYTFVNKEILVVDNYTYFINDNKLVNNLDATLEAPTFTIDFWKLRPNFIYELVMSGEESYTKEYSNGQKEYSYLVTLEDFIKAYDESILDTIDQDIDEKYIEIILTSDNSIINKASINLTTYYNLIDFTSIDNLINIEYE